MKYWNWNIININSHKSEKQQNIDVVVKQSTKWKFIKKNKIEKIKIKWIVSINFKNSVVKFAMKIQYIQFLNDEWIKKWNEKKNENYSK